jgi:hypothetical protein
MKNIKQSVRKRVPDFRAAINCLRALDRRASYHNEEPLFKADVKYSLKLLSIAPDVMDALLYAEKELTAIYETAENGATDLEVTIGQYRRLREIRAIITRAGQIL